MIMENNTLNKTLYLEFLDYLNMHDLDEDEYEILADWSIIHNHSVYENPDHFCAHDGVELSYMKWYWILSDNRHPCHKRLIEYQNSKSEDV